MLARPFSLQAETGKNLSKNSKPKREHKTKDL